MARICFVTYEIAPTTRGGCGALIANAARMLLEQNHEVVLVLDIPIKLFNQFLNVDRLTFPHPERLRAYHVSSMCNGANLLKRENFLSEVLWRSYRFHIVCQQIVAQEKPDLVEFFEYTGIAQFSLAAKIAGLAYKDTPLAIRVHTSIELIDRHEAAKPLDINHFFVYGMEHVSLQLAEYVVYPSHTYLEQEYYSIYEPWFGSVAESQSPLVDFPSRTHTNPDAHIILFYGRLFQMKGVDLFIESAVALCSRLKDDRIHFVVAGFDPAHAPDGSSVYSEYLKRKIPAHYLHHFEFPGQLDRKQLETMLPDVCCAVIPSYLESFGYAAHELYAAGVPMIVSSIPGFADFFIHEKNALVFDNGVTDLANQIERLVVDHELRAKLTLPYPVATNPLGTFYSDPPSSSWINPTIPASQFPALLICVIDNDAQQTQETLNSIQQSSVQPASIVLLQSVASEAGSAWLFGSQYSLRTVQGDPIEPTNLYSQETFLLLRSGDRIDPSFLERSLETLGRQPQIVFVGSWKRIIDGDKTYYDTTPLDVVPELSLFRAKSLFQRVVMRTPENKLIIDLFDSRVGSYSEIQYLLNLDDDTHRGIFIPDVLITQIQEPEIIPDPRKIAFITLTTSARHKNRLSLYLALDTTLKSLGGSTVDTAETAAVPVAPDPQQLSLYRFLRSWVGRKLRGTQAGTYVYSVLYRLRMLFVNGR